MDASIDNKLLRSLDASSCASYFFQLRQNGFSESAITARLLDAVQRQSVSPLPLMSVWLSFAQSPATIKTALSQSFSLITRKLAIEAFGRLLNTKQWRLLWTEFGVVEGIVELFSKLSVIEVTQITTIIRRQIKAGRDLERDANFSGLLRALIGSDGADAIHRTSDQRPLVGKYLEMLPACDVSFVEEILCQNAEGVPDHTWKMRYFGWHSTMIAKLTLESIFSDKTGLPDYKLGHFLRYCLNDMQRGFPKEPGCSVSMSFGLHLLRRLTKEGYSRINNDTFLRSLVEPLLSRAWKRRKILGLSKLREIFDLSIVHMSKHPKFFRSMSMGDGTLVYWTVRCWSLDAKLFEDNMTFLMTMLSVQGTTTAVTNIAKPLLRIVQSGLRHRLLRKLFVVMSVPPADLDSVDQLSTLSNIWDAGIFTILPREDALPLLMRLRQANPDLALTLPFSSGNMQNGRTIVLHPTATSSRKIDTELLYHVLNRGQEGALISAENFVLQQKNKSITSREQTDRAFYAKATLFAAVASGSLVLLKEIMIWLRRYTRDALTVKTLYDDSTFGSVELIDLLAAIPESPSVEDSIFHIAEAVSEANAIMISAYETACQALRQPSFHAPDWRGPLNLFQSVIETRLDRVKLLQRVLRLSDDQLYVTVWESTLDMLTGVERSAVQSGNAALDFDRPSGPFGFRNMGYRDPKNATPASFRFVDNLARGREDIWHDVRRLRLPAVTALPEPWPRGLSIAFLLTPLDIGTTEASGHTPFLSARTESIVFTPKELAIANLPEDEAIQTAIGPFFESYKLALRIYVLQGTSTENKQSLIRKAWEHAFKSFTRDPMTDDEKIRYVNSIFADALPGSALPKSSIDHAKQQLWPLLPEDAEAEELTAWDPWSEKPGDIKGLEFLPKVIDSILSTGGYGQFWIHRKLQNVSIQNWSAGPIWMVHRFKNIRRLPVNVREGLVISWLLQLDSKIGGTSRLLATPFPSTRDIRYPPLFLDSDFMLQENNQILRLSLFTPHVPLDLVRSLADRVMKELALAEDHVKNGETEQKASMPEVQPPWMSLQGPGLSSSPLDHFPQPGFERDRTLIRGRGNRHNDASRGNDLDRVPLAVASARVMELERILYELIGFLASSDRPQLAADLSIRIVLNRPDASSWHRRLLGITYLKSLPLADVQLFFSKFGQSLSERLHEQEVHKDDKEWKKPYVKVTTLKYIAQLLEGVEFISRIDAVKILVKLYAQAKHIDVRVATVESLLSMLSLCNDQADELVANAIIEGLRETISLLGGPSERRQYYEEDWAESEKTGKLPEVSDDKPITDLLIDAVARRKWSINPKYRRTIMSDVLEPIIQASSLCNERWVKLFSKHNSIFGSSAAHERLLSYPIKPSIIESLVLLCSEILPAHLLQQYHEHTLAMVNPDPDLSALKRSILADSELRSSKGGVTFLSLYNTRLEAYRDATVPLSLLKGKWKQSLLEQNGITLEMVQKMLCDLSPEFLAHYDEHPEHFDNFVAHLQPPLTLDDGRRENWIQNIKPVLESIVSSIDRARGHLVMGKETNSSVLPSTFKPKLWLLDWPFRGQIDIKDFTTSITTIIEDLTSGVFPLYHRKFQELCDMLQHLPSIEHYVQVARELGDRLWNRSRLCRALIIEAQELLLLHVKSSTVKPGVLRQFKEIARIWIADKDEETRRRGFNIKRTAESLKGWEGSELTVNDS